MPLPRYANIDPSVLFELVDRDVAAFCDLSNTFLKIAPPNFASLCSALLSADYVAIAFQSHALKGTAALVGATELTTVLQALEVDAHSGKYQKSDQSMIGLTTLFNFVIQDVQASIRDSVFFHDDNLPRYPH